MQMQHIDKRRDRGLWRAWARWHKHTDRPEQQQIPGEKSSKHPTRQRGARVRHAYVEPRCACRVFCGQGVVRIWRRLAELEPFGTQAENDEVMMWNMASQFWCRGRLTLFRHHLWGQELLPGRDQGWELFFEESQPRRESRWLTSNDWDHVFQDSL